MEINRLECFPAEDGHIESVLIGVEKVKVSFQTWDARMLVLIFNDVGAVTSLHSVYEDIGEFEVVSLEEGLKKYTFRSAWSDDSEQTKEVISIVAKEMEIVQVGVGADINSALFDVGYEYIGNQKSPYFEMQGENK